MKIFKNSQPVRRCIKNRNLLVKHWLPVVMLFAIGSRPQSALAQETADKFIQSKAKARVLGFLPHWEPDSCVKLEYLTDLMLFSAEANCDGSLEENYGWTGHWLIEEAHRQNVEVTLVITFFEPAEILKLVTEPEYTERFCESVVELIEISNFDGIMIDFEGPGEWRRLIDEFLVEVNAAIKQVDPGCELSFAAPPVNWGRLYDFEAIANACDYVYVMAYPFNGSFSEKTGPMSPLTGTFCITNSIERQFASVASIDRDKLIIGVPYFGYHWLTDSPKANVKPTKAVGVTFYRDDAIESQKHEVLWDEKSQTPWYRWQDAVGWHQVWYDNAESLNLKCKTILDYDLGGIGIWALGYDGDRPEFWEVLKDNFFKSTAIISATVQQND